MSTLIDLLDFHFKRGIEDLNELTALVSPVLGKTPPRNTMSTYRALYRRFKDQWIIELRKQNRSWAKQNAHTSKDRRRSWAQRNLAKFLLIQMRRRCVHKNRNWECTITAEQLAELLEPMVCSVTGISLEMYTDDHASLKNPWAPSVDRIDCNKGYTPDNVRVVCWLYNHMRGDYSDADVLKVAKAMVENNAA